MKKLILAGIILLAMPAITIGQDMNSYCSSPPFVGGKNSVVIPNVLIVQDMTGSMAYLTYKGGYGYANPDYNYRYVQVGSRWFFKKSNSPTDSTRTGRYVDSTFMERIDVARKALTGGRGPNLYNKDTLFFYQRRSINWNGSKTFYGVITTDSTERKKGVIREIVDKNDDFIWDSDAPRFALMQFSTDAAFMRKVFCPFGDSLTRFIRQIETTNVNGATWVGDAVFEAIHYMRYCQNYWSGDYTWNSSYVGTYRDPWYEVVGEDTVSVSCRPTFVIVVTDGESNSDNPRASSSYFPPVQTSPYGATYNNLNLYNGPDSSDGTNGCADDYAYYAHIRDLRPDLTGADSIYNVPDQQSLTFYSMFLFATDAVAPRLCKNIAIYGGFVDSETDTAGTPGYLKPDKSSEYDSDNDHKPDNYYQVDHGEEMEEGFREIFINIGALARVTSASAGAITGTTSGLKSGAVTFLSQFYPRMIQEDFDLDLRWLGRTQALWLDPYGWIREDNAAPNDHTLDLKNDHIVSMFYSVLDDRTMAALFEDSLGTGNDTFFIAVDTVAVESLQYVWDASKELRNIDHANRRIYTNLGGRADFVTTNDNIDSHLGYYSAHADSCDKLIQYIRGREYPLYRTRTFLDSTTWKLGDIVYSTPMPVSAPPEAYHMIYGDTSYYSFWNHYLDRRSVVYVGANDGMIHAFNSGRLETLDDDVIPMRLDPDGHVLGGEMWAHVPKNLLPHLKWLKDTSYCHVYYNDLRTYPTDVQIFPADASHINGWGSILISGMRFGGSPITVDTNTYSSAYSCLDVTDPEHGNYPGFMWEFTDDSLGYTLCIPVVVKITAGTTTKWFVIFGSGPQSLTGECTRRATIYVVDPSNGQVVHKMIIPDNNTAITNIFGTDWGLNYSVELLYFGTYDNADHGKIYRINTHENIDPTTWSMQQVINLDKPITAEGSVATDSRGNLWIYFGTGKYLCNIDVADTVTQLFVGIKEDTTKGALNSPAFTLADLLDVTDVHIFADTVEGMTGVGNFEDLVTAVESYDGWYRRLNTMVGERVVTPCLVFAGAVVFTTFAPHDTMGSAITGPDLCIGGGGGPQSGNLWALFYLTGTAYKVAMLDTLPNGEISTHIQIIGDMPSEPSWYLDKLFVQSAGGFGGPEFKPPYNPYGGIMLWRGR